MTFDEWLEKETKYPVGTLRSHYCPSYVGLRCNQFCDHFAGCVDCWSNAKEQWEKRQTGEL